METNSTKTSIFFWAAFGIFVLFWVFDRGSNESWHLIAFVIAAGLALFQFGRYLESKRRLAWSEQSRFLGLEFSPKSSGLVAPESSGNFYLFHQGHSRKSYNFVSGQWNGLAILVFDYRYTVGGGKHSNTYNQTVFRFQLLENLFPPFLLRKETLWDKATELVGFRDIDFPDNPEFSSRFYLSSKDETGTRAFFSPDKLSHIQSRLLHNCEADGDTILFYNQRKRISPEQLRANLDQCFEYVQFLRG